MQDRFFTHNTSLFHYRVFGNGPKLLFCFHGYGRDSYTFGFLAKALGTRYTIVALDAPFHGFTKWDNPDFEPDDLVEIVHGIRRCLNKEGEKISLLGFSMGGRIALHLTQMLADEIERVVLLAPDGLKYKSWLWFTTQTWAGSRLFDYTVHHPQWFLSLVHFLEKLRIIKSNVASFVDYYLEDKPQRIALYRRWNIMRNFKPKLSRLKKIIPEHRIKVRMLFGSFDRIIHYASGQHFLRKIEKYASVKIIEAGHDLLREWHTPVIAELFND